jgi:hypothetical protein
VIFTLSPDTFLSLPSCVLITEILPISKIQSVQLIAGLRDRLLDKQNNRVLFCRMLVTRLLNI